MKIAILANNYGEPWAEGGKNNVRQIALALSRRHDVIVLGLGPVSDERLVDGLRAFRFRSPFYDNRFARVGYPFGYLSLIRKSASLLRAEKPDAIFSYFETASTALAAAGVRRFGAPRATLFHTVWSDWYTRSPIPPSHWVTELFPQLLLNGRTVSRIGLKWVDRILVSSRYLGRRVESLGRTASFTPTGVDTERFRPRPDVRERFDAKTVRIGYVGHFTYTKGVSLLLEAFAKIAEIEPDVRLVLAAAGDFEESETVRRFGHPRIEMLGLVDAAETFSSFDVTVLPRRYSYGTATYPNVLVESMACGVPVLTSRLPAIDELITDGVNGFLFQPNDAADLRDKLLALIRDRDRLRQAGAAARARALQLDWSSVVPMVIDEIEKCSPPSKP